MRVDAELSAEAVFTLGEMYTECLLNEEVTGLVSRAHFGLSSQHFRILHVLCQGSLIYWIVFI